MVAKSIRHHPDGTQEVLDQDGKTIGFEYRGIYAPVTTIEDFEKVKMMLIGFDIGAFAKDPADGQECVIPVIRGVVMLSAAGYSEDEARVNLHKQDLEDEHFAAAEYRKARIVWE